MSVIHNGDCLEVMRGMAESSVDAIVTDPPYGLAFMGKNWDHGVPGAPFWEAALRVAKPGCHLLAFGGTRTFHRLVCAIEDAGWEVRDVLMWVYGSGFPKSLDVSKALDKREGAEREVIGQGPYANRRPRQANYRDSGCANVFGDDAYERPAGDVITKPATEAARQWAGWGTALKPAYEPILVARKPLSGTVAENVQAWGTGALNIDGCRVGTETTIRPNGATVLGVMNDDAWKPVSGVGGSVSGRWPANLIHDGSDEVEAVFPVTKSGDWKGQQKGVAFGHNETGKPYHWKGDSGSASRFFYCAKASPSERGEGNNHPTVKPQALMQYLCRLVTPPGGVVLDPFAGSGTTGVAALQEGFRFVGIEKEAEYVAIAEARMAAVGKQPQLF